MSTPEAPTTSPWVAPGPGSWERDVAHQDRPFSALWFDALPPAFSAGFAEAMARFGLPFQAMEIAGINGWSYGTFGPIADEAFPERMAAAEEALVTRPWRAIADEWYAEVRQQFIDRGNALQSVALEDLDDAALAEHIQQAIEFTRDGLTRHFLQSAAHWVGVGLLANEAAAFEGWPPDRVIAALSGASPASVSPLLALARIRDAIAADPAARAIVEGVGDPAAKVAQLTAMAGPVGEAMDAYLQEHGWQVFSGFDFTNQAIVELPALLLATIRNARPMPQGDARDLDALRSAVPAADRDRFEALIDDALITYGIRDDDSGPTVHRPLGLARRALLEAGTRLERRGAIESAEHVFDATRDEIDALLSGSHGAPAAAGLAARSALRQPPYDMPPARLGEEEPPPEGELPPAMATVMNALFTSFALEGPGETGAVAANMLAGVAASPGVYEGTARLVSDIDGLDRLEPGDILVTAITTPAYNVILPLLGAVVTDSGGVLSHPAIVAREAGIPAVTGTGDATARIADGARIRVDGSSGLVELL